MTLTTQISSKDLNRQLGKSLNILFPTLVHLKNACYLYSTCSNPTNVVLVIVLSRLPKGMAFIPFLFLSIAKDREHLRPRPKFSLSFAMKRDKSHPFWKPGLKYDYRQGCLILRPSKLIDGNHSSNH